MMNIRKLLSTLTWIAYLYPVLMLASLYATWFLAWGILGHQPRPSLDDPKYISTLVDFPYGLTMVLMTLMPGALFLGAVLTPLHLRRHASSIVALVSLTCLALLILSALWAAIIAVCWHDP